MSALLRIIDANANRAREGLRVMEDIARFALDDPTICGALKSLRHELRLALESLPGAGRASLLAARDTQGDVGAALSTPGERSRAGLRDIALAAAGRVTEAIRSIEEASKAMGGDAAFFEAMRYRAYSIEKDLGLSLGRIGCPQWRLCVLITESLCARPWAEVARAAVSAGADCLQLREKELDSKELLERARRLVSIARDAGGSVAVVINDRPDIALLAGADGVHLGQQDLPVRDVRALVGDDLWIGLSTANNDQARNAARQGADYCGVGPMFATTTKHKPVLSGPAYLREYLADEVASRLPHLAIGGISVVNVKELASAGCRGVAVSSAVCAAPDPEKACRELIAAFGIGPPGPAQDGHSQGVLGSYPISE